MSTGKRFKSARHVAARDQWLGRLIDSINQELLVTSKKWYKNKPAASVAR